MCFSIFLPFPGRQQRTSLQRRTHCCADPSSPSFSTLGPGLLPILLPLYRASVDSEHHGCYQRGRPEHSSEVKTSFGVPSAWELLIHPRQDLPNEALRLSTQETPLAHSTTHCSYNDVENCQNRLQSLIRSLQQNPKQRCQGWWRIA